MVGRGHGDVGTGQLGVGGECRVVALSQRLLDGVVKGLGPGLAGHHAIGAAAVGGAQVVGHVAAAQNQHATVAQRGQIAPHRAVKGSRLVVDDGQLKHRDVCPGVQVVQHRPGAVVQPPILRGHHLGLLHKGSGLAGTGRVARRGVADARERRRKAAEVVDGFRPRLHVDGRGAARQPVGRNAQDGAGARQLLPPAGQAAREGGIADGIHGAAVADENHWHAALRPGVARRLGVYLRAQRLQRRHGRPGACALQPSTSRAAGLKGWGEAKIHTNRRRK